jgi:hypothetical protein
MFDEYVVRCAGRLNAFREIPFRRAHDDYRCVRKMLHNNGTRIVSDEY